MERKSSIHIKTIQPDSDIHNFRKKEMPHVRGDLTPLNEILLNKEFNQDLTQLRKDIENDFLKAHGKKMHPNAAPIREAVAVLDSRVKMQHLQDFAQECFLRWQIIILQIFIHRDEGHSEFNNWVPNYHSHLIFLWYNFKTHKTIKLQRQQMAQMQTILAKCLGMERGNSSDLTHLNSIQYKIQAEENRYIALKASCDALISETQERKEEQRRVTVQLNLLKNAVNNRSDEISKKKEQEKMLDEKLRTQKHSTDELSERIFNMLIEKDRLEKIIKEKQIEQEREADHLNLLKNTINNLSADIAQKKDQESKLLNGLNNLAKECKEKQDSIEALTKIEQEAKSTYLTEKQRLEELSKKVCSLEKVNMIIDEWDYYKMIIKKTMSDLVSIIGIEETEDFDFFITKTDLWTDMKQNKKKGKGRGI